MPGTAGLRSFTFVFVRQNSKNRVAKPAAGSSKLLIDRQSKSEADHERRAHRPGPIHCGATRPGGPRSMAQAKAYLASTSADPRPAASLPTQSGQISRRTGRAAAAAKFATLEKKCFPIQAWR